GEISASEAGAATQVEFFGGWVGAAVVLHSTSPEGTAALRCVGSSRRTWYLPDELTTEGRTAYVVVMNPFAEPAEFDVFVQTEKRSNIHPGPLAPYVLNAHRSVAIKVNDYVLQSPGEDTMTVRVQTRIGRVVAGSLDLSPTGIRAEAGVPEAAKQWVFPVTGYEGTAGLALMSPADLRSQLSVIAESARRQEVVSGVNGLSVAPASVTTFQVHAPENEGSVVKSLNGRRHGGGRHRVHRPVGLRRHARRADARVGTRHPAATSPCRPGHRAAPRGTSVSVGSGGEDSRSNVGHPVGHRRLPGDRVPGPGGGRRGVRRVSVRPLAIGPGPSGGPDRERRRRRHDQGGDGGRAPASGPSHPGPQDPHLGGTPAGDSDDRHPRGRGRRRRRHRPSAVGNQRVLVALARLSPAARPPGGPADRPRGRLPERPGGQVRSRRRAG